MAPANNRSPRSTFNYLHLVWHYRAELPLELLIPDAETFELRARIEEALRLSG